MPCSTTWCELPANHEVGEDDVDGARIHSCTLATWENDGRTVYVQIGTPVETVEEAETVEQAGVNRYVGETGGDDLTAERARSLAAFVSVALNAAADRIEAINAR